LVTARLLCPSFALPLKFDPFLGPCRLLVFLFSMGKRGRSPQGPTSCSRSPLVKFLLPLATEWRPSSSFFFPLPKRDRLPFSTAVSLLFFFSEATPLLLNRDPDPSLLFYFSLKDGGRYTIGGRRGTSLPRVFFSPTQVSLPRKDGKLFLLFPSASTFPCKGCGTLS